MSGIFWLASYPKSGNTWFRILLANFQRDADQPLDINSLVGGMLAVDRTTIDQAFGVASSDMTPGEIERWRPEACRYLAARSASTLHIGTHDAYRFTQTGEPLIPSDVTRGAIYVVRNPLDVAVSFSHHFVKPVEEAINRMGQNATIGDHPESLRTQLRQGLSSWSGHVTSWLDQSAIPVHVVRYEDMSLRPIETFGEAVRFLGLADDVERVRRAVEFSAFDLLRQQELTHGFKEKQLRATPFFRQGRVGGWREVLTEEQVAQIISDHKPVMRRLGFLSETSSVEPVQ